MLDINISACSSRPLQNGIRICLVYLTAFVIEFGSREIWKLRKFAIFNFFRLNYPVKMSKPPVALISAAGNSAIYRNLQSVTSCREIIAFSFCGNFVLRKRNIGDICLVDVKIEDHTLSILCAVNMHLKWSLKYDFINHSCQIEIDIKLSLDLRESDHSLWRL